MTTTKAKDAGIGATPIGQQHPVVAMLVDDQPLLGHAMKHLLGQDTDIQFHFCQEPLKAAALAEKIGPTVFLLDLAMPEIHGLSLLRQLRANPATSEIPTIVLSGKEDPMVKAQAFASGANDYLVKLPDRVELIARIRHHSREYAVRKQKSEAYRKLVEREGRLSADIANAATHVKSLLPGPVVDGPIRVDWRFIPSMQLGGDAFGYQWLDDEHFAIYLLDVTGHDVGASLLAVSVLNILSHRTLSKADFHDPASVLHRLNQIFNMARHCGRYFTIWYGVFSVHDRQLTFSGGGHPPALLFSGDTRSEARLQVLENSGPPIGVVDDIGFGSITIPIPAFCRLLLYSDGAVEIGGPGRERLDQAAFTQFAARAGPADDLLEQILSRCEIAQTTDAPLDDRSLMLIDFR